MKPISGGDVLTLLIPTGGWTIAGDEYEGITFIECEPITKAQFDAAFANYESIKAEQEAAKAADKVAAEAKRQALLDKLGITEEEAKLLLS
jgi:hypothetical protein